MSKIINRIKVLMSALPEKDISLGHKYLDERDFDSLKELVDSAEYKVKKSQKSETPKEAYAKINLGDLSRLKSEIDMYIIQSDPFSEDAFCSEINDDLEEEDFYNE